jgi:hypothetical protein
MAFGFGFGMPRIFSASRAFSPASFFANGEQGWWFDPSNFETLFQDSAGTTPVTAVEQPVGLQLDLSQGLVLGPELLTNPGPFTNTTGWTASGGTLSVVAGALRATSGGGGFGSGFTSFTTEVGKTYKFTFTVAANGRGRFGTSSGGSDLFASTTGTVSGVFRATGTTSYFSFFVNSGTAGETTDLASVTVKLLPGNHRFQTADANRPVVSALVNLLTKTEQFDDAVWVKAGSATVTTKVIAPNGTLTADTINLPNANDDYIFQQFTALAISYRAEVYLKGTIGETMYVYLGNGTSPGQNPLLTFTFDGTWQQLFADKTLIAATQYFYFFRKHQNGGVNATASTFFAWGADLRPTNQGVGLPAYQRVNTSTDYDSTGFPVYIKPNGANQSMQTNSINFTATDKMTVWQGVRKSVDTAYSAIMELSTATANGSVQFGASSSSSGYYVFGSKGTFFTSATATNLAAPITNVITGIGDISGDVCTLRVNGAQAATSSADQGPGNYGNHPAYFYMRAGTSLPFDGNDYGSIARGAASTAAQITAGETYMAAKTGVTLLVETFDFITTDAGDQIVTDDGDSVITDIFYA